MMTYEEICDIKYLEKMAELALSSSCSKPSSEKEAYLKRSKELLEKVQYNLQNELYTFSKLRSKIIHEPKERKIDIPPFYPDRIYQHAMMDAIKDKFHEQFIDNTFSSIKGRGLLTCKNTLESIIKDSQGWYYVNADAKKYFENIDHDVLKQKLLDLDIDPRIYKMHCASIDMHNPGIAIGCYPSQYYANLYLSDFDHMMMWVTGCRYVRYMDNWVFWVKTKQEAHYWLNFIRAYFKKFLGLTIKENWQISRIEKQPLQFCGYTFYSDHTLLRKNIKLSAKKKARKLDKQGVSDKEWKQEMAAYYGWFIYCSGANLWKTIKKERVIKMKTQVHKGVKTLKEIKNEGEFGLKKDNRVSINDLVGKEVFILDAKISDKYRNGERLVVKYQPVIKRMGDDIECGDDSYFITGSDVLKDRILKESDNFPFVGTIVKLKSTRGGHSSFYTIE